MLEKWKLDFVHYVNDEIIVSLPNEEYLINATSSNLIYCIEFINEKVNIPKFSKI